MIRVKVVRENNIITSITAGGHAFYAPYGKDIVCSSFSTMIIVIINSILDIDKNAISYVDNGNVKIINIKKDNITNSLLNTLVNTMYELKKGYNKNIDIKEENHE